VETGADVTCVDSLITGRRENLQDLEGSERFRFIRHDISEPLTLDEAPDLIYHLASPASPADYARHPIETLRACSLGTLNMLDRATAANAVFILTSTSEVYGDPELHPQSESYWGRVNPIGPRSPYDEGKRFSEAATMAYQRLGKIKARIARLFNTFGPGMRAGDGRMIPNFIHQALTGSPLTIYGDGNQTRSLCYVEDTVEGLLALEATSDPGPFNIGNPEEMTVMEVARLIIDLVGSQSAIEHRPLPQDDPMRRRPDISRATKVLGWSPKLSAREGLIKTIEAFREALV
jgi:dTDP-glucose 4,6-dehydratase